MKKEGINRMARNTGKKNFILVVEITTKCVKIIVEGPHEHALKKWELERADLAIERKANELFGQYPPNIHEVIRTRASNLNDLQKGFPEFSDWNIIIPEQLTII